MTMKKLSILLLLCMLGISLTAAMPSIHSDKCLFYYEFKGEMPQGGFPDISGHLKPLKPNGTVATGDKGSLKMDGQTTWLSIPGSEALELPGSTLLAYVKLANDSTAPASPDSFDALFFRKYELTFGRNRSMLFCDNRKIVSGPKWTIPAGTPVLIAISFAEVKDGKSYFTLYLDNKQCNWLKPTKITNRHAEAARLPLEFGRNSWDKKWFLNGEVTMIAMYKGAFSTKELKELQEHLKFGEETSLAGETGDFTADFFYTPRNWDASSKQDVILAYITLGGHAYPLVKKASEQFLTLGDNAAKIPVHSMAQMGSKELDRPSVKGRHIIFRRKDGCLQFFVDGFPAEGQIQVGNAPFQGIFLNPDNGRIDQIHYFRNARNDRQIRELFRMRVPR